MAKRERSRGVYDRTVDPKLSRPGPQAAAIAAAEKTLLQRRKIARARARQRTTKCIGARLKLLLTPPGHNVG